MNPAKTVIAPAKGWPRINVHELWSYRDLIWFLGWRNIRIRYKQTVIGAAWAVLQPLSAMLVFSLFFGRLAKMPSDGVEYPIFVYCALLPWQLFSFSLNEASSSLVSDERLITKVYFPRLVIPLSSLSAGVLDFMISSVLFMMMMVFYGVVPAITILAVPLFVLMTVAAALGMGLWLSALNVQYRDVRHALPFVMQFWIFASPVAYSSSLVPPRWRWLYGINPLAGVIEGFRWAFLGTNLSGSLVFTSAVVLVILLITGLFYFRRMERKFADLV